MGSYPVFTLPGKCILLVALSSALSPLLASTPEVSPVNLHRGAFEIRWYDPGEAFGQPRGTIIFGSGDGGWSYWEERVCGHLASTGWFVAGVDFRKYSETDFSREILRADYVILARALDQRASKTTSLPLLYGGWSMGAELAVAAGADPNRPDPLRGLLLVAPGARWTVTRL